MSASWSGVWPRADAQHDAYGRILTMRCYMCELGDRRYLPGAGPEVRVLRTFITGGPDPTEAYELACGHTII